MGNYCCNNEAATKFLEIEESKRERVKINSFNEDDRLSLKRFSICSIERSPRNPLMTSVARRYLTLRYLSIQQKILSNGLPCSLIFRPLTTPIEIQLIEERLTDLPKGQSSNLNLISLLPCELLSGDIYQGQWNLITRLPEGFGIMIHPDQSKYSGGFKDGKKSGMGRLVRLDGEIYEGEFHNNFQEGKGKLTKSNGVIYRGMFKKGKEHGEGVIEYEGDTVYEGNFMYGAKHGFGKLKISEGNNYEGEFVNNCMEGQGIYIWDDGKVYKGGWKANKIHGDGKYMWPDGREYEGSYADGNRDGYGVFRWPDGREYRGEWLQGNMHGLGVYTFCDKNGVSHTIKAQWENGKKKKIMNN